MKKILITQRFEKIGKFDELRDNLDSRLPYIVQKLGYLPILIPNNIINLKNFVQNNFPNGIILSGGGDPLKKDLRHKVENELIKISIKKNIPIIGICRGAQALNVFFGGKLSKVKNHVRKTHIIYGPIVRNKKISVNSYHDFGFFKKTLGKNLTLLAHSSDNVVKCFRHVKYKFLGIMWHPERYKKFKPFDKELINSYFRSKK